MAISEFSKLRRKRGETAKDFKRRVWLAAFREGHEQGLKDAAPKVNANASVDYEERLRKQITMELEQQHRFGMLKARVALIEAAARVAGEL